MACGTTMTATGNSVNSSTLSVRWTLLRVAQYVLIQWFAGSTILYDVIMPCATWSVQSFLLWPWSTSRNEC